MVSEEGLSAAAAKKGSVMEINNKKNHLSHILFFFIMLLFAAGLTMNVLFCSNYNLYGLSGKTTVIEARANSESSFSNEGGDKMSNTCNCGYHTRIQPVSFYYFSFSLFLFGLF